MTEAVEFTKLAPDVYVAGQLEVSDIKRLVPLGVNTLVCNRPDGEADQTSSELISAAAEAAGIKFVYLPMTNPDDTVNQSSKFREVLVNGGVVLAYCRTGRRSSALWQSTNKT
ncbi:MAG: TIGR01244 family phosphatase [Flavobacteriales bacterium]|nr:TIGR01244 family phosphatase [Flavobacteriales bacterium]